jgi:hypothetical protein
MGGKQRDSTGDSSMVPDITVTARGLIKSVSFQVCKLPKLSERHANSETSHCLIFIYYTSECVRYIQWLYPNIYQLLAFPQQYEGTHMHTSTANRTSPFLMIESSMQPRNDFHVVRLRIRCNIPVPDEEVDENWVEWVASRSV